MKEGLGLGILGVSSSEDSLQFIGQNVMFETAFAADEIPCCVTKPDVITPEVGVQEPPNYLRCLVHSKV